MKKKNGKIFFLNYEKKWKIKYNANEEKNKKLLEEKI